MTSNDNQQYVTVEIYNAGNNNLEKQIILIGEKQDRSFSELKTEIQAVRDIALVNSAKIDAHWEAASMWFSVIAILVTVVGIFVALAAVFREIVKAKTLTEQKVQDMINASISQAVSDAVEKALASFGK